VVGRGESGGGVGFLEGPPWWEAISGREGGDARPSREDEMCGRRDRAQNDVMLRNVGGAGQGSGSMITTVTVFFFFFFSFFFNLAYLLFLVGQNAQLCSSHGVRYKGPRLECKLCRTKPPTTVLPCIPKLKSSEPARQRKSSPPGTMGRNYKEMRPRA